MNSQDVKVGSEVVRLLGGEISMPLKVTALTDAQIVCGAWTFDRKTGAEIDEELEWGPPPLATGSYLVFDNVDVKRVG